MNIFRRCGGFFIVIIGACVAARAEYHVATRYPVGGEGTYDYIRFDASQQRLFVAHSSRVEVVDANSGKKLGEISGIKGAHGVALAPEFGHGFISSGANDSVVMFDLATLQTLKVTKAGTSPDGIEYDAVTQRVYVCNVGNSGDVTVIDPRNGEAVATIAVAAGGVLEQSGFDGAGRMFINEEHAGVVEVLDLKKLLPVAKWPVAPGEEPAGFAIDRVHGRIFSACGNRILAVIDLHTGRVVAQVPIGLRPDGVIYDEARGVVFVSNRDGTLTVIRQDTPDTYSVLQTLTTDSGCRTMTLDEKTGRVFMPNAKFGPTPAPTAEVPKPRRPVLPGSFEILVVEK